MKIKNEAGEEVEVFTAEDVDAKVKAVEDTKAKEIETAVSAIKTEYEGKITPLQTKLSTLETEKTDLEAKLSGGDSTQQGNFKTLKDALDKKTTEIEDLKKGINDMKSTQVTETRDALVTKFAGKDEELAKKIKDHFDNTLASMPNTTSAEIAKKVEAAAKLASDGDSFDPLGVARAGAGGQGNGNGNYDANKNDFTANEKSLGTKLGITEADYKKYGPKVTDK